MMTEKGEKPVFSGNMERMMVADKWHSVGLNFHIYKRSAIPNSFEVLYTDDEKWEAFRDQMEQNYEWEPDERLELREGSDYDERDYQYVLHIKPGITLFKKRHHRAVTIYYDNNSDSSVVEMLKKKLPELQADMVSLKIGYVTHDGISLSVKFRDFKPYKQDLTRFMGEELVTFRERMVRSLKQNGCGGLYLLHGKPGTGKTSFIKSVLSEAGKRAIYMSPAQTDNLTSPALIGLLMDYPDSILVIEDAETVLMKRQGDNSNAVSNLLNMTDGFPADFLNLNIICTFNTRIENIDPALLRKGRLKGICQFRELTSEQASELAAHLGVDVNTDKPMSLAEVCNGGADPDYFRNNGIGFVNTG